MIVFRDANGLYWQTKYRYIFSSVFNAVTSVVLVGPMKLGVLGALLGTSASLVIMISFDPVLVYRHVFRKPAGEYYRTYFLELALVLLTGGLVFVLCRAFSDFTPVNFLARAGICLLVPNGLWYLMFRRDPRFNYLRGKAEDLLKMAASKKAK